MRTACIASIPSSNGLPETFRLDLVESFEIVSTDPLRLAVFMVSGRAGELEGNSARAFIAAYAAFKNHHMVDYTPGIEAAPSATAEEADDPIAEAA